MSADVYVPALPHDDRRHLAAHHFLVEEAAVLDARAWEQWLRMLHDDIRYVMPVRVNTAVGAGFDERDDMAHFDENAHTLRKRIERLRTARLMLDPLRVDDADAMASVLGDLALYEYTGGEPPRDEQQDQPAAPLGP